MFSQQLPTLKYTPAICTDDVAVSHRAYMAHFAEQQQYYGRSILINLINQTGSEGRLEQAFRKQV